MKIDIRDTAAKLNIKILDKAIPGNIRGSAFKVKNKWIITVNSLDPEERKNFTIAHELAEIELDSREDLSQDEKHHQANIAAGKKLIPDESFKSDVHSNDLLQLKEMYPQASYEVIARRILAFKKAVLTIFDNYSKTLRIASEGINYPHLLLPEEKEVIDLCYKDENCMEKKKDNIAIQGYFIEEQNGIKRVIMRFCDLDAKL